MKFPVSILMAALFLPAQAATVYPKGCSPLVIKGETVTFEAKKNKMVFIHNSASNDLWITHPSGDQSASAGWSSRLQPNHWSALAIENGVFLVYCIESRPGHEQQVPCEGAIAACEWTSPVFAKDAKGTFWAGEDMSVSELIAALGERGFGLTTINKQQGNE